MLWRWIIYLSAFSALLAVVTGNSNDRSTKSTFTLPGISIPEAPAANILELQTHPIPNSLANTLHKRRGSFRRRRKPIRKRQSASPVVNTIFSGVYPVVNITWGNKDGISSQTFISFIDTGSSDTFAVADNFQCADIKTKASLPQTGCSFGPLYNVSQGKFTNITDQKFQITYFPEMSTLHGSMGYAPLTLGGLTVPKQEVALVDYALWSGDTFSSGLLGLGFPDGTSASSRANPQGPVSYDPIFTTMVKQGIVKEAVFTLAIDRVPRGTPPSAPAGVMALGGLVPSKYYDEPFTSVPIEATLGIRASGPIFYATTHEFLYGLANGTIVSGGKFQSIVDSGTAPNMLPRSVAEALNKQFVPPAKYNRTLSYWVVDCNAKPPYAAYKIGGKVMPMDPRDMIVRSLNGLLGYENTCFSAFSSKDEEMIIGAVWQRGYVVAYDQGRNMLHFAARKPY